MPKTLTGVVVIVGPAAWRLKRCEEGGRRWGALALEAVKCESGAPSPRSTPSNSSPKAIFVFPLPLLVPASPTRRFKFDVAEYPPIFFLSPLLPPIPEEVDVVEDTPVDIVFLVISMIKIISPVKKKNKYLTYNFYNKNFYNFRYLKQEIKYL